MIAAILFIAAFLIFLVAAAITYGRTKTIDLTDIGLAALTLGAALVLGVL